MKNYFLFVLLLLISSSGLSQNVGIGTTTPVATLDVKGNHHLGGLNKYISFDTVSGKIFWTNSKLFVSTPQYIMQHSASAEGLYYGNSQLEYREPMGNPIFFTNWSNGQGYFSGKLGIGTTTPAFKLDVKNGSINTDSVYRIGTITVLSVRGTGNLLVGKNAGRINTGSNNTFSGDAAGYSNTVGFGNTAYGYQTLYSNFNGGNTAIGLQTLHNNIDGEANTAIGDGALYYNTGGKYNTADGYTSLYDNVDGWYNTANGESALTRNISGSWNTANGGHALSYNETGIKNTAIGYSALSHNESGTLNTGVGYNSDLIAGVLTNATAIGANARVDCSNCLVLGSVNGIQGSESNVNVGIGVNSPGARLSISTYGVELAGSAAGNAVRTNAGTLGTAVDSEMSVANFGFASGNNSSLGIRAYRTSQGADWTTTSLLLENDVDNTPRAGGGFIAISANGNIGIGTVRPLAQLHVTDKSVLFSATGDISGMPGPIPLEGAGRRMMWYADKSAFRSGYVAGTNWNKDSIGNYSTVLGSDGVASGAYSFSAGASNHASGLVSIALGANSYATGNSSVAIGDNNIASNYYSLALGSSTMATGYNSTAMGSGTTASGDNSTAMGAENSASGVYSTAMGSYNFASGTSSVAMGQGTNASGSLAVATGNNTIASGAVSTAMGSYTKAQGIWSTALGAGTTASGWSSTAIGSGSIASGISSVSIGISTTASGESSMAIGRSSNSIGFASMAGGHGGNAIADFSIAFGESIIANAWASTTLGRLNDPIVVTPTTSWVLTEPLLIVGNGTGPADKKNAMVILKNGNIGIGTNNPLVPLAFASNTGKKISLYDSGGNSQYGFSVEPAQLQIYSDNPIAKISFGYYTGGVFTERMYLDNSSNTKLTVNGNIFNSGNIETSNNINAGGNISAGGNICATGSIGACSDIRYKTNLSPLSNSLDKVLKIHGLYYFWKKDEFIDKGFGDKRQIGFSAQELEEQFPEIVQTDSKGYKSVDYSRMTPILLEAIKEQQKQIDVLQKNGEDQLQQIEDLKKIVMELASRK